MLKISIISVQPKMFEGFLRESIVARAVKKGACEIDIVDLRNFGEGRWKKVDDKPYGGGPGMLMKCGPWFAAVEKVSGSEHETSDLKPQIRIIMTSPAGRTFTQRDAEMFASFATDDTNNSNPQALKTSKPQNDYLWKEKNIRLLSQLSYQYHVAVLWRNFLYVRDLQMKGRS